VLDELFFDALNAKRLRAPLLNTLWAQSSPSPGSGNTTKAILSVEQSVCRAAKDSEIEMNQACAFRQERAASIPDRDASRQLGIVEGFVFRTVLAIRFT